jgi:hypothetical protein
MRRAIFISLSLAALAALLAFVACFAHAKREPFAIAWNYDTSGYLETCGCSSNMRGGLARRATLLKQLREKQPVLAIEGAHILLDKGEFQLFKGEMIVQALGAMDYAALCLGVREAQQGAAGLKELTAAAKFPCICANLSVDNAPWPTADAVVEIAGARVGIVALSEPVYAQGLLPAGVAFSDPRAALDAALGRLKGKTDLVVACLEGNREWLDAMAADYSNQVGLFLTGDRSPATASYEFAPQPPRMNCWNLGKYVAIVTVDPAAGGDNFSGLSLPVEDKLAPDAAVQGLLDKTYRPQLKERFFGSLKQDISQLYLPPDYCADCHKEQCDAYAASGHAQAQETLQNAGQLYNPDCMKCHVVYDAKMDQLHAMNCVSCHTDITDKHVYDALAGKVARPAAPVASYSYEFCAGCHDELNSTQFKGRWPQYVKRLYHGGDMSAAETAAKAMGLDLNAPWSKRQAGQP